MYTGFKHLHSTIAFVLLAGVLFAIIYALISKNKPFAKGRKFALLGLIFTHIQFLVGLFLYFTSPLGFANFSGAAMKDKITRLYIVEHPLLMLIAVVLVTIGWSRAKRLSSDRKKYNSIILFYTLGFICMLAVIPWKIWLG